MRAARALARVNRRRPRLAPNLDPGAVGEAQLLYDSVHDRCLGRERLVHGALELGGVQQHLADRQRAQQRVELLNVPAEEGKKAACSALLLPKK